MAQRLSARFLVECALPRRLELQKWSGALESRISRSRQVPMTNELAAYLFYNEQSKKVWQYCQKGSDYQFLKLPTFADRILFDCAIVQ